MYQLKNKCINMQFLHDSRGRKHTIIRNFFSICFLLERNVAGLFLSFFFKLRQADNRKFAGNKEKRDHGVQLAPNPTRLEITVALKKNSQQLAMTE